MRRDFNIGKLKEFRKYLENADHFDYFPVLLHANLSLDHWMYDPNNREFSGGIDFGDLKIGDSDYEYIYLMEECGREFTERVMEISGPIGSVGIEKVSFFLLADHVRYLLESIKRKDKAGVKEAKNLIQ